MCIWCKLPPWIRESQCCFLWNHSKSVMHTCEECCDLKTCNLQSICIPSTPSHWLICSRRRSIFIRANPDLWKNFDILADGSQPELGSVYCKTTMWACLSGTTCSHVCSRTSSCFGACYRSSSPENPATSSRRFVLQTFVFLPRLDESGISWHQPDLNLRQIWWLERFPRTIILVSL